MPLPPSTEASNADGKDFFPNRHLQKLTETLERLMREAPSETQREQDWELVKARQTEAGLDRVRNFPWNFRRFSDPDLDAMFSAVGKFALDLYTWPMASQPRWLSLLGPSETGKTHLARCLWEFWGEHCNTRRVLQPGGESEVVRRRGKFVRFGEVLDGVLGGQKSHGWVETLYEADFLVVDDPGTENITPTSKDVLYRLFDARAGSGTKPPRWTVITSNLSLAGISERYDARLASRMRRHDSTIIELPTTLVQFHDRIFPDQ